MLHHIMQWRDRQLRKPPVMTPRDKWPTLAAMVVDLMADCGGDTSDRNVDRILRATEASGDHNVWYLENLADDIQPGLRPEFVCGDDFIRDQLLRDTNPPGRYRPLDDWLNWIWLNL